MSYFEAGGGLLVFCEVEVSQQLSKAMTGAGLFLHHPYYYASMKQRKIATLSRFVYLQALLSCIRIKNNMLRSCCIWLSVFNWYLLKFLWGGGKRWEGQIECIKTADNIGDIQEFKHAVYLKF